MRNNNFDILRLLCALLVIVSHSYALLTLNKVEPLWICTGLINASDIGLCGFFTISGYLILNSLMTSKNIFSYLGKRCLRIFPGLLVCLIIVVAACSFFYTGEGCYWRQLETYSFIWNNLSLYNLQWEIPGVFADNPFDASIDGSLWTLAHEFTLYLLIIVLFFARKYKGVIAGLTAVALVLCVTKNVFFADKFAHAVLPIFELPINLFAPFAMYFLMGMLLLVSREWRERILDSGFWILDSRTSDIVHRSARRARWIISGICGALMLVLLVIHTYIHTYSISLKPLIMLCMSVLFIMLGEMYWKPVSDGLKRIGDMSYGTYIYAFPIQQMLIAMIPGITPIGLLALTVVAVLPLAFASWRLVERNALSLKKYL